MLNFAGLCCSVSKSLDWHRLMEDQLKDILHIIHLVIFYYFCATTSEATITSWKSGFLLSALTLLISVLSDKAVLDLANASLLQNQVSSNVSSCLAKLLHSSTQRGSRTFLVGDWGGGDSAVEEWEMQLGAKTSKCMRMSLQCHQAYYYYLHQKRNYGCLDVMAGLYLWCCVS